MPSTISIKTDTIWITLPSKAAPEQRLLAACCPIRDLSQADYNAALLCHKYQRYHEHSIDQEGPGIGDHTITCLANRHQANVEPCEARKIAVALTAEQRPLVQHRVQDFAGLVALLTENGVALAATDKEYTSLTRAVRKFDMDLAMAQTLLAPRETIRALVESLAAKNAELNTVYQRVARLTERRKDWLKAMREIAEDLKAGHLDPNVRQRQNEGRKDSTTSVATPTSLSKPGEVKESASRLQKSLGKRPDNNASQAVVSSRSRSPSIEFLTDIQPRKVEKLAPGKHSSSLKRQAKGRLDEPVHKKSRA